MNGESKQPVVLVAVAAAVVLIVLVLVAVLSAEHRAQANAKVQQEIGQQVNQARSNQITWQARLPEVYTFSEVAAGQPKKTATAFQYTLTKNAQTMGKEVVVANEVGGPISVDQSDAALMPDSFKCYWLLPCQQFATDAAGDKLYVSQEPNSFSFYYGLVKGKSIIRITARKAMSPADVIAVANSLKLATPAERQKLR